MKISEVSKRYDLSADTLRYYEHVKLIPGVPRNKNGIREYTEENCKWIEFVKCMRGAGLPIDVLAQYVTLSQQGDATIDARKRLLIEQRDLLKQRVQEMQETLQRLDYKIKTYEKLVLPKEKELNKEEL